MRSDEAEDFSQRVTRVSRGKREQGTLTCDTYVLTSLFSPLASPLSLLTQIASHSSSPDWELLAVVLTRLYLVFLFSPCSCRLNTEDWLRVEAEVENF